MGQTTLALLPTAIGTVSTAGAVLAALVGVLPLWCVIAIVGIAVALVVTRTIVTQIIRLRASKQVTASADALRLLEIEDSPRPRRRDTARKLA